MNESTSEPVPVASAPARRSRRKAASTAPSVLSLPIDAGIEHTAAMRALLAPHLDAPTVTLDASQVQRVHTSTMQLLLMFCRDRTRAGRATVWHDPSATVQSAARLLGLVPTLELARELS